jgi:hypothetical protein
VITLSYIAELSVEGDALRFTLPTTVAPRYVPLKDMSDPTQKELAEMPYSR